MANYDYKLLTVKQVADILLVHKQTVRKYIRDGKLKCIRLGPKAIRISRADLNSFIESRKG